MTDPAAIAALQLQLASINARIASGVRDVRFNNRSTTFDLKVLQDERVRIEAQLAAADVVGGPAPMVRRLLVTQRTKGL